MTDRLQIRVRGRVQGVGFRPFIWREATALGLVGDVRNDREGVLIRVVGKASDKLVEVIRNSPPQLSVIHSIEIQPSDFTPPAEFCIVASGSDGAETVCVPDVAVCADCRAEIEGSGRRTGYAFTNCTNCGPRFTIMESFPYDRAKTTMSEFEICADCQSEYDDPRDRRFHAQPIACPACGPTLAIEPPAQDPLAATVERLLAGEIIAIKGLGGFHLVCDATNPKSIDNLRIRKQRPSKPFALMGSLEVVKRFAVVSEADAELLTGSDAPIVLLQASDQTLPEAVAPGMARLGWMLPYTPLHHLLVESIARPLIMTSGNLSKEPQVIGNEEAVQKLGGIADSILSHNRRIARRLDDGVVLPTKFAPMVIRRARGQSPWTMALPGSVSDRQVIAFGGDMKAAICLTKNKEAILSHHLGELDNVLAYEEFLKTVHDLADLMDHRPELIAVDMHPEYHASRYGRMRAADENLALIEVQHHHAHMAAALGTVGWQGDVAVGLVLDGLGFGSDGTIWGGEVLAGDYKSVQRMGHLAYAPLPGGDQAQREPWRNALMRLDEARLSEFADRLFPMAQRDALRQMVEKDVNSPPSSSVGRLFDAIAACLGIAPENQSFEGEAAMKLEKMAAVAPDDAGAYELTLENKSLDPSPLFRELVADIKRGVSQETIAVRCHQAIANSFADLGRKVAEEVGATTIALSGGCFQSRLLLELVVTKLSDFELCGPGPVPVNDGGLAFGQTLVALAQTE